MVQRRSARFVTNCYDRTASVTDMLNNLGWDYLKFKAGNSRLVMMYMLNNGLAEIDKYQYLVPESQVRKVVIYIIWHIKLFNSSSTNYHKFSFFPRTIKES